MSEESQNHPTGGAPWLSVRGAAKSYGGVRALRGVDLDLSSNQVYGIIGPNGAGKSTLMKVLGGLVVPDSGEIVIEGVPVSLQNPSVALSHGLVLMPQEMTVVPEFTVSQNINLGNEPTRFGIHSRSASAARAQEALTKVGLEVELSVLASSLQPVERRLLMLAKALAQNTRLLILDEPTAGLPPAMSRQVIDAVLRLRSHGLTIVYVSHHLSEVAALSDHVVCIREGAVSMRLSGQEISKDTLIQAILGKPTEPVLGRSVVSPAGGSIGSRSVARSRSGAGGGDVGARDDLTLSNISGDRLREVNFTARNGEVTGITGLLGSGVSELVAVISGSTRPLAGRIRLGASEVVLRSPADALSHGIGTVTGDRSRSAMLSRTIRENVSVTALRRWFGRTGIIRRPVERSRVADALASLSVIGDAERPLTALSGGNQQRVLVSRLLAADLRVMVFDDPTVGVDIASRAELWRELQALASGRVILVASAEAEELIGVCDRVICIHNGEVSQVLEGDAITEHALARATS
ncbi:sugar ABC transporter ATP-binding protein [Subtercola frigoramans]|uniref:ABC-type sugar transport system ATPase subunit n=1 Tax=Subtercola frigoramans TaxID=120298 RepID=A0ABS2L964_9MICO|nr:sugar ABC transporter ATP-binding protein [Subtercola frigoramans]MBM7473642.1 ABC-type sugar transport system ATPase subunit [Subtercola frigoramans]